MSQFREDLEAIEQVVTMSTHILERNPEQLYNQINGRGIDLPSFHDIAPAALPPLQLRSPTLLNVKAGIQRILLRHTLGVNSCAFRADGKRLVSASADATLRVWDVETGDCLLILPGHQAAVLACAYSPDGLRILSASEDTTLRLWDAETGEIVHVFTDHAAPVNACAFSPDGLQFVSASGGGQSSQPESDNSLRLWNVAALRCEGTFPYPEHTVQDRINACAFSSDGKLVVSGHENNHLYIWDVRSCRQLKEVDGFRNGVTAVTFFSDSGAPDVYRILSTSSDQSVHVMIIVPYVQGQDSDFLFRAEPVSDDVWHGHTDSVSGCALTPDRSRALTVAHDHTGRLWDVATGTCTHILRGHTAWVNACAISANGRLAATAANDNAVIIWDLPRIETVPADGASETQDVQMSMPTNKGSSSFAVRAARLACSTLGGRDVAGADRAWLVHTIGV